MAYLDGPERALKRAMAEQKPPAIVVVPDADANASWLLPTVQPMKKCQAEGETALDLFFIRSH